MRSLILLLCCFFTGCTTYKYLGTEQPQIAIRACAIQEEFCTFSYYSGGVKLNGSHRLQNIGHGVYTLSGSAKLDLSEKSALWARISRLQLTFIFFKGDLVVHEEKVTLSGETNKYIKFSKSIELDTNFESSIWINYSYRVTG
jgi:hypothetical protein